MTPQQLCEKNRGRIKTMVLNAGTVGIRMSALIVATKLSEGVISRHLSALAETGVIEKSATKGPGTRWGSPGIFAAHQATRDREAKRREARRLRVSQRELSELEAERWAATWPTKRVVPAHAVPPLGRCGPASVWEIAA